MTNKLESTPINDPNVPEISGLVYCRFLSKRDI
jgi:hypothetical protein